MCQALALFTGVKKLCGWIHEPQLLSGNAADTGFRSQLRDALRQCRLLLLQGCGLGLKRLTLLLVAQHGAAQYQQGGSGGQNCDQNQNFQKR